MKANEILKKHEDANEMHFHEVDRKWIIEAMEEYAALRQPLVSKSAPAIDWHEMRKQFFDECVEQHWITKYAPSVKKVSIAPHDLFEWFRKKLAGNVC